MYTMKDALDQEGLEIAKRAEGREFTPEERDRLHFINTLATKMYVAEMNRKHGWGKAIAAIFVVAFLEIPLQTAGQTSAPVDIYQNATPLWGNR